MFLCPTEDLEYIESNIGLSVEKLRNKIFFLTGATGFIGKNLIESLVWLNRSKKLNLIIYSVSRDPEFFFKTYPHFKDYCEFHLEAGDIRDKDIPFNGEHVDYLIHAATDVVGMKGGEELFSVCVNGTSNILKFAKKNRCTNFLLLSSGAIYGKQPKNLASFEESRIT